MRIVNLVLTHNNNTKIIRSCNVTKKLIVLVVAIAALGVFQNTAQANENSDVQIGAGAHYWVSLEDLDTKFDDNALSYYATIRYNPSLWGVEANVEYYPKETLFAKAAYEPQAFFILGNTLYAGIGLGWLYSDGDWADDPTYAFKAGFNIKLMDTIAIDINANYKFTKWDDIDADLSTINLGAAVRFCF
jgi:hypothetical protein